MTAQRILGCVLLAAASLLAFAQICFFFTMPGRPMLPDYRNAFVTQDSIETLGFVIPTIVIGFFLLCSRARCWLWFALIVTGAGLWLFVIRELWLHYYLMPHKYQHYALVNPPYFQGALWWVLVRLSWHITLPAAFVLTVILLLSRAANLSPEPPPLGPVRPLSRFTSQIRRCSGPGR